MHCGAEVTESSTNKQQYLSLAALKMARLRAENSIGNGAGWTQILPLILIHVPRTRATLLQGHALCARTQKQWGAGVAEFLSPRKLRCFRRNSAPLYCVCARVGHTPPVRQRCGFPVSTDTTMLRMIRERLCSCMLLRARARRTHPIQTMEFLVKVHRAQDRALLRAANMTEVQLTVEDAVHDVVDVLLEDLTSLRRTFYARVENVTARAQSTRGSR